MGWCDGTLHRTIIYGKCLTQQASPKQFLDQWLYSATKMWLIFCQDNWVNLQKSILRLFYNSFFCVWKYIDKSRWLFGCFKCLQLLIWSINYSNWSFFHRDIFSRICSFYEKWNYQNVSLDSSSNFCLFKFDFR